VIESAVVGLVVGGGLAWVSPWQLTVLVGWAVAAALFLTRVWVDIGHFDARETRDLATREDDSRTSAHLALIGASVVSLVGVAFDLVKANRSHGTLNAVLTTAAVVTVVLSWAVVHTLFTLRYAHEYYSDPPGGINFNAEVDPDYQDFAYLAFTVGMTFQVSDTNIEARIIRRTILRHALLSYLFGAVILAVTVNVIASVIKT
jgi:uncharacterized membrane protein